MADQIMKAVLDVARSKNADRVVEIELDIGDLTFLNHEQLRFCLSALSEDTIAKDAKVMVRAVRIQIECEKCSYRGPPKSLGEEIHSLVPIPVLACVKCGSANARVIAGNECVLRSIRIKVNEGNEAESQNRTELSSD